ncbi:AAA family ATPase [Hypoxylon sp. FL1857]|nr:AAA family ATPase [Hypoxylon sp. FL1857]
MPRLTDEQRILAVPTVRGFALESKVWCSFKIANISSMTWDDGIFRNLVLDNGEKELLLALIARNTASDNVRFDDFTKGKGKGLLLLLCGAPGTGKTLTAEAVAETLRRPLYRVRAGDLGVTAGQVERSLKHALDRCTHWNAVLLIDEADIFLEQRSTDDIVRSELVSIFLVLLEYYEGIMILTTNRIECIDPAFESRIDIILGYKDLTRDTRRQIWSNFIRRLPPEAVSISSEAIEDLSGWSLNGRQIKSSIKTGWTLSASKGEPLRKEHLDLVLGIRIYGGPGWVLPMVAGLVYLVLLYSILLAIENLV